MKIFIPSWGRAESIKTHLLLQDADYKVVLHNEDEKARYVERSPVLADKIVVSGMPKGISGQRQWIKDNLVADGEWFCMMDDNIKAFNIFPEPYYGNDTFGYTSQLRKVVEAHRPGIHELLAKFSETIRKAEEIGTGFCGFANIENSFFRKKKWKTI